RVLANPLDLAGNSTELVITFDRLVLLGAGVTATGAAAESQFFVETPPESIQPDPVSDLEMKYGNLINGGNP
ncbi:MAG: hypothetical protein L0287_13655, partial [Anaerolineae bacterium]|nr:hypothetical protein [Anaerolineae bacterium]